MKINSTIPVMVSLIKTDAGTFMRTSATEWIEIDYDYNNELEYASEVDQYTVALLEQAYREFLA